MEIFVDENQTTNDSLFWRKTLPRKKTTFIHFPSENSVDITMLFIRLHNWIQVMNVRHYRDLNCRRYGILTFT